MCLETADISYKETGSEILALLHESSEIKHFYPKFNRAQRRSGEAFGLFSYKDQKGTLHLAFDRLKQVPNPILKFYSMMECKRILEKICNQFLQEILYRIPTAQAPPSEYSFLTEKVRKNT